MNLHTLKPNKGSVKTRKRIGRGPASGAGGTAGRGHKGAKSRSGYSQKFGFEGGQMPLQRRIPKFGFRNPNRVAYKAVNLDILQGLAEKTGTDKVDFQTLRDNGLVRKHDLVKILGRGELKIALTVAAHKFSASAQQAIEAAGGKAVTL